MEGAFFEARPFHNNTTAADTERSYGSGFNHYSALTYELVHHKSSIRDYPGG